MNILKLAPNLAFAVLALVPVSTLAQSVGAGTAVAPLHGTSIADAGSVEADKPAAGAPYGPQQPATQLANSDSATDRPSPQRSRWYLAIRYGRAFVTDTDVAPGFKINENFGQEQVSGSFGYNWGRYFGLEVALDYFESDIDTSAGKVSELSTSVIMPQVRLRYPLMDDRLTPYVIGGVGAAYIESNDKTPLGAMPGAGELGTDGFNLAFGFGAGVEYFVADNVAFGIEAKYVITDADVEANGVGHTANLNSLLVSAGARLFYPGLDYQEPVDPPSAGDWWEFDPANFQYYAGLKVGAAPYLTSDFTDGFTSSPEALLNGVVGIDFNRHFSFEVAVDTTDAHIEADGVGQVFEYTFWIITPQVRVRYPVMGDRLVPYLVGGVGAAFSEINDRNEFGESGPAPYVSGSGWSLSATAGAGIEYFIADNMTLGFEARYLYHRPDIKVDNQNKTANFDAVMLSTGVRVYF